MVCNEQFVIYLWKKKIDKLQTIFRKIFNKTRARDWLVDTKKTYSKLAKFSKDKNIFRKGKIMYVQGFWQKEWIQRGTLGLDLENLKLYVY